MAWPLLVNITLIGALDGSRGKRGYKLLWGCWEANEVVDKNECRGLTGGIQRGESVAVQA